MKGKSFFVGRKLRLPSRLYSARTARQSVDVIAVLRGTFVVDSSRVSRNASANLP